MIEQYATDCNECGIDKKTKSKLCTFCITQKVFKGKWKLLIYWHLHDGTKRFNELSRLIPSTQTTLSRQLKELVIDGIINRKVFNQIPPKVEYSLTPLGKSFENIMNAMDKFGIDYLKSNKENKLI
ncbi:MAG: winged helix-turn-helix transcriptional regulator [Spirochaetaceae bacterium]|nr:winged helix-turn-helix transcriptional regulator [Spirochaetaceae bacterium]